MLNCTDTGNNNYDGIGPYLSWNNSVDYDSPRIPFYVYNIDTGVSYYFWNSGGDDSGHYITRDSPQVFQGGVAKTYHVRFSSTPFD